MGLNPRYYIADFQSGDLLEPVRLSSGSFSSSLQPGRFSATIDLRQYDDLGAGQDLVSLLLAGKCSMVVVLEGVSNGADNPPTSRSLGEWWISQVSGTYRSPLVSIGGPEFEGYASYSNLAVGYFGTLDPVVTTRNLLNDLYTVAAPGSVRNVIQADLQNWVSHTGARVPVELHATDKDYWSAISSLQNDESGPFEWMMKSGLVLDGWSPLQATRTLEIGQPELSLVRNDISLEVTGPGQPLASLVDASWSYDEAASASTVYAKGAGSGVDQVGYGGSVYVTRERERGEPSKTISISVQDALTTGELRRHARGEMQAMSPRNKVIKAPMPTSAYTPRKGERYRWFTDDTWAMPASEGYVRCAGWSWKIGSETYDLELAVI